jgi:ribosomal subunit interface protein
MQLSMTFRNTEGRKSIQKRAEALFEKLLRFLDESSEGKLSVNFVRDSYDVQLVVVRGKDLCKSEARDSDLRTAVDRAFHVMEVQLRRAKERRLSKRKSGDYTELLRGETAS